MATVEIHWDSGVEIAKDTILRVKFGQSWLEVVVVSCELLIILPENQRLGYVVKATPKPEKR